MLIMALLVLGIGFIQNVMELFSDVLSSFNGPGCFVGFCVSLKRVSWCGCKGKIYINGAQWLKPQANLKWVVASRAMNRLVVVVFHIRKVVIPCAWMFRVVHPQDVHDHPIEHLYLAISLGMEDSGFGEHGVQQCP
jgi:hypothetical protein